MNRIPITLALLCMAAIAMAAVPPMINYQGKLLKPDGTPVADGTYAMEFAIYDVPTGGRAIWWEANSNVQVKKGLFSVLLGSVVNLPANVFDSPNRWFGVKVGDDPEMTPRQQVTTTAFAFKAAVADTVPDGAITTQKIASGAVTQMTEVAVATTVTFQNGNYVDQPLPGAVIEMETTGAPVLVLASLDVFRPVDIATGHTKISLYVDGQVVTGRWVSAEFAWRLSAHRKGHASVRMEQR